MLEITLSHVINAGDACDMGFAEGKDLLNQIKAKENEPINLLVVLDRLGLNDTLYCLGAVKPSMQERATRVALRFSERCIAILKSADLGSTQALRRKQYAERCYENKKMTPAQRAIEIASMTMQAVSIGHDDSVERYTAERERQEAHLREMLNE